MSTWLWYWRGVGIAWRDYPDNCIEGRRRLFWRVWIASRRSNIVKPDALTHPALQRAAEQETRMVREAVLPPGWRIELGDTTDTLLREIAEPEIGEADVAVTYRLAMMSSEATDWSRVNRAIIDRWSRAALLRIKEMAWKPSAERT